MSTTMLDRPARSAPDLTDRPPRLIGRVLARLTRVGVPALRISLGLVIAGFGALKFFPGASPAEGLVMQTTSVLTFGLVEGRSAALATAVVEVLLGLVLLAGKFLRPGLVLMAGWLMGILSPVVLFPTEMFPGGLPTLTAQYVLKDVILAAAWLVIAAHALGARMTVPESPE